MTTTFKIRSYTKWELGQLYSPDIAPDSARKKLMIWIGRCPELKEALQRYGMTERSKMFTPVMVRLIVEALGEP